MSDSKRCVRCERIIDLASLRCPFCNWDQSRPLPSRVTAPTPQYVPPPERRGRKLLYAIGGFILLVVTSFALGARIHGKNPPASAALAGERSSQATETPANRSNVTLVPDRSPLRAVEEPITSAPATNAADGVPAEYQRSDATAVSSAEYAQLARRVKEEKRATLIDPRTITGNAYNEPVGREEEATPETAAVDVTTRPVPEYQPLPNLSVRRGVTARLALMIGPDGRVRDIDIRRAIPGDTPRLLSAVQSWRFKPATRNGRPIPYLYTVDITFGGE